MTGSRQKESRRERFNRIFLRFERSKAYAEFCRRVSGKNLRQVSMADMAQISKLLAVLKLRRNDRILDVGCGIGGITEYIYDATGAHVTGLDFAERVIRRAQRRTEKKKDRLAFKAGDMRNLRLPKKSFNTIVAIDSLYFVKNLVKTMRKIKSLLTSDGQMGIFYTQTAKPEEPPEILEPGGTKLACVLSKLKLKFRTWNFTEREIIHWRKRRRIALKLIPAFKNEGNLRICKEIIKEAEYVLKFVNSRRISRYLYHVRSS